MLAVFITAASAGIADHMATIHFAPFNQTVVHKSGGGPCWICDVSTDMTCTDVMGMRCQCLVYDSIVSNYIIVNAFTSPQGCWALYKM